MGTGLLLRRRYGTTHDTKDVSKTTDTQYSAAPLHPTYCGVVDYVAGARSFKMYTLIWH